MTSKKEEMLLDLLEEAVIKALKNSEGKDHADAIGLGIRLAQVKYRIGAGGEEGDFFGGDGG